MARLLIVSNRLPVNVKIGDGSVDVTPSEGGLATGMRAPHQRSGGLWLGWPGDVGSADEDQKKTIEGKLAELQTVPIHLTDDEVARFYEGFSNGTIWPLFHYLLDRVGFDESDWETYRTVNERFADEVVRHYRTGDRIWVHDYQLLLLPALLRDRLPHASIGFFLHIPFPASEVFRILPWRREILRGMLGADLIGFHATSYMQHWTSAALRLLGLETRMDGMDLGERQVRVGVFPMGVDSANLATEAASDEVSAEVQRIRDEAPGQKLLLAIDRLDYTKGIRVRLRAIERLFETAPELRERVRFVQIAVPSRTNIQAYEDFRRSVDEAVGRINGRFGTTGWTPIQYLYRSIGPSQLLALYRAADVALVTPLRDGMNLVAKEFVASRVDDDGVLVLSELAGAAEELDGALLVNPYDVEGMVTAIRAGLDMGEPERKYRMRALRARVMLHDVHRWADAFLAALADTAAGRERESVRSSSPDDLGVLSRELRDAPALRLLLDYDGTLAAFASTPDGAAPDGDLKDLLRALAARPRTRVCIVSGRTRSSLEEWFGDYDIDLAAEHGYWTRLVPGGPWVALEALSTEWKDRVRPVMAEFAERTPGAWLEEKGGSIAWHYRRADAEFGSHQVNELHIHLATLGTNLPLELIRVDKVLEARSVGLDKGRVARDWLARAGGNVLPFAMGNDRTDEDMFAALGERGVSIHVGPGPSQARYRVPDPRAARAFLWSLVK